MNCLLINWLVRRYCKESSKLPLGKRPSKRGTLRYLLKREEEVGLNAEILQTQEGSGEVGHYARPIFNWLRADALQTTFKTN